MRHVAGACVGAGVDLITACDLRYCTKGGQVGQHSHRLTAVTISGQGDIEGDKVDHAGKRAPHCQGGACGLSG